MSFHLGDRAEADASRAQRMTGRMLEFVDQLEAAVLPARRAFLSAEFFRRLTDGSLTRAEYARLLTEIYHYVKHSTRLLALAAARTSPLRVDLFRRFVTHIGEESGHEQWALQDLHALGIDPHTVVASSPAPETEAMVALQYYLIEHETPLAVLGYIYALETLGSGPASAVAARLKTVLNVADGALTFFTRHSDSDVHHVKKLQQVLAAEATSPTDKQATTRSAVATYVLYKHLVDHICESHGDSEG
jgi:pyrroloquinoline quinone (PQQ) biosynthesis protein C